MILKAFGLLFVSFSIILKMPIVKAYRPPSWYTREGAQKKLSQLEAKGLPSFRDWRFITLTVDPKQFASAQSAYEYINERFRYFMRDLRHTLGVSNLSFIRKLEFQRNGWPHWHVILDYKKKIDHSRLLDLWSYGFVEIQRIKSKSLKYLFKYVAKGLESTLPSWFLQYSRPRIIQTSKIFPSKEPSHNSHEGRAPSLERGGVPESLGQRLKRWDKTLLVKDGYHYVATIILSSAWWQCLAKWMKHEPERIHYEDSTTFEVPWDMLSPFVEEI